MWVRPHLAMMLLDVGTLQTLKLKKMSKTLIL